ncbi:unnamed protein product [Parajaminaea phylloscopi]
MAAPATSSFRPPRKFSVTAGPSAYGPSLVTNPMSPSHSMQPPPLPMATTASPATPSPSSALPYSADGGIGASLIGPGGAALQNGAPAAANSIANKPAMAGSGLYQSCVILRERLWCVPEFGDRHLAEEYAEAGTSAPPSANDPVTQLFAVFRRGTCLVELYNLLNPANPLPTSLGQSSTSTSSNACKKLVAKFIIALQEMPGFDAEEMFTVMQVYGENTNDWVKVVRVVSKVIDKLEERGILIESERAAHFDDMSKPCDDRAWIVKELIESERKYVQDLEVLQSCARALQQHNILSTDRVHDIFCNVNNLVDFQRRCLINLEDNARKPPQEQRFGRAFQMLESNFVVYWPFCSNYAKALEVIAEEAANIQQLRGLPAGEGCYLDPAYELPAFLIKPVQRICKYPLLLEQLLKKSDPQGPYYDELKEGLAVVQRGAAKVNEVRREQENIQIVADLYSRVDDWKGHHLETFGNLLLSETFMVAKGETEREYLVYLFDRILLCCKEVNVAPGKKPAKSNSLLKQRTNSIGAPKRAKTSLQLKGRIFVLNVTHCTTEQYATPTGTAHALIVQWRGDPEYESFSIRCKNEEQVKQWQSTLQSAAEEAARRQAEIEREKAEAAALSGSSSPVNMAGAGANGRRSTGPSMSVFPQTPLSEGGHVYPFSRADSQMGHRPSQGSRFLGDDDDMASSSMHSFGHSSVGGRGTPASALSMSRFSQPAEQRARQLSLSAEHKPRAMTENSDSATLTQWRSHSPNVVPPPLPRQPSGGGDATMQQTIRKAASSRQLRQNSSSHSSHSSASHSRALARQHAESSAHGSETSEAYAQYETGVPVQHPAVGRHRGESNAYAQAPNMMRAHSDSGGHLPTRHRSASTSQVSSPLHFMQNMPPVPRSQPGSGLGSEQLHINTGRAGQSSGGVKRASDSSNSTMESGHSGASRPGSTAASSPLTMSAGSSTGGSLPGVKGAGMAMPTVPQRAGSHGAVASSGRTSSPAVTGNVVKVQVHYGDDVYTLVVLANINFMSLLEKVVVKVRVCSGSKDLNEGNVRLRYIDEDGDRVALADDDDVQMAVEHSKATSEDIVLYVS